MNNETNFAEQFADISDEKLLEMFESDSLYTREAMNAAHEEANKRGGLEALKIRVGEQANEKATPKPSLFSSILHAIKNTLSSLKPDRTRFERYPALYVLSLFLRVVVLVFALIAAILVVSILINLFLLRLTDIMVNLMVLFYLALASAILLAISEGFLLLVDIEKNTRS